MKKIMHRSGAAIALRLSAVKTIRKEERKIYREALLEKKAAKKGRTAKVEKAPAFKQEEVPAPLEE